MEKRVFRAKKLLRKLKHKKRDIILSDATPPLIWGDDSL